MPDAETFFAFSSAFSKKRPNKPADQHMNFQKFRENRAIAMFEWHTKRSAYLEAKAIVLRDAKMIYFPVPKAGNSSAKRALSATLSVDPETLDTHESLHSDLIPTVSVNEALQQADEDWELFTIVRHPYKRAYSAWRDKVKEPDVIFKPAARMGLQKRDRFVVFLLVLNLWPVKRLNDHFAPQTVLLRNVIGKRKISIYHLEDLAAGWPEICDKIEARGGIRPEPLPHLNVTSRKKWRFIGPIARLLLRRLYRRDFKPLGY